MVDTDGEAGFFQDLGGFLGIADDHSQDAEVRRVGKGKGTDIDVGFSQNFCHFTETAGPVFQKYRDLFGFHEIVPFLCSD